MMMRHSLFLLIVLLAGLDLFVTAKRVLVTGAAGFVGSHVADFLLARGDQVVVVDEVNDYYDVHIKEGNLQMLQEKYDTSVSIHRGDICDNDFMDAVFAAQAEQPFDAICHMAARAGVRPSIQDPFLYVHSNVEGTVKLMDYAVKHRIGNFVFASSSSVYGGSKSTFFSELERVDHPISPYAATKKSCELFSYVYQHVYDLNVTALRFFTVYGPRGRPDMAPFKFIDHVWRGHTLQQFGDGTSSRDYTYIDDIVNGVVRSIDTPTPYQILNLGKGSGTVLKDFLTMVEKYVGKEAKIEVLPDQPGDVPYTCANVTLAHEHLGYEATVPFEEGIQRTVEWYKETYAAVEDGDAVPPVQKSRSLLRRKLGEHHTHQQELTHDLQRLLAEDSTVFADELFDDHGDLALVLGAIDGMDQHSMEARRIRRRRQLWFNHAKESTGNDQEESAWKSTKIMAPHTGRKKVLVTGGAGFIGSHVVEFLLSRGDDVVVVDKHEFVMPKTLEEQQEEKILGNLFVYKGDLTDAAFMTRVFDEEKPEWICHLAARTNVTHSLIDPVDYIHSNIEATLRLLELSKGTKHGGSHNVRNFVLASSSTVYGNRNSRYDFGTGAIVRSEDERVDYPKTPYASSKKSAELLAFTFHRLYRIPVSVLRLFGVYGPRYRPDTEPFQLVDRLLSDDSTNAEPSSSGSMGDFLYIADAVQGIVHALDRPYGYEIFNLGSGSEACAVGSTAAQFAQTASNIAGKTLTEDSLPIVSSNVGVDGVACADTRKAEYLLDFKASVSMEEGLQRTMVWHQQTYYPGAANPLAVATKEDETNDASTKSSRDSDSVDNSQQQPAQQQQQREGNDSGEADDDELRTKSQVKVESEEKYSFDFPVWLPTLRFLQWVVVVCVLSARALYWRRGSLLS